ncbi:ribosome maturation factor RimP [Balneola sp. MJW-20]|uniref:ribosome maturation factor RimP n=1 Tax=Gracilimonas aurantiaca TaxID=3234185 RepID=UPI0034664B57
MDIKDKISELVAPLAEEKGMFLVDIDIKSGNKMTEVWIYLDAEDRGVNLDECADVSRELGFLLDAHETMTNKYRLNVSSPGLSRPLSDPRQYPKNIGRVAKVKYKEGDTYEKTVAILTDVNDERIVLTDEDENFIEIALPDINEIKIVPTI